MSSIWARLFGSGGNTAVPIDAQIAALVAARLDSIDAWKLPTVVAGRQLIADTAAIMPMVAHNGRERVKPTPTIIRRPDPREPTRRTIEKIVNSMTGWGNAWLRVYDTGRDGRPIAVRVIHPERVAWELSATGDEIARLWVDGIATDLRTIKHIPMVSDLGPIGRSPLTDIGWALEQLAAVFQFSGDYYDAAGRVPPYALKHPNRLTQSQAQEFADEWANARTQRRPAVLSGGIELETYTAQTAADAALADAMHILDAAIARALLVPPSLLNVVSNTSLTYSTTVGEFRRWLQLGLLPGYLARIEAAFSDMLPRGIDAVFDTSALVRMDFAARIDAYADSIAAGIHTPAEVRALEGLPVQPDPVPQAIAPNVEGL